VRAQRALPVAGGTRSTGARTSQVRDKLVVAVAIVSVVSVASLFALRTRWAHPSQYCSVTQL
ncbi:unnamed protein product, partial [Polarella glacialis]